MKQTSLSFLILTTSSALHAAVINLTFGDATGPGMDLSEPNFGSTVTELRFANVGTGVNGGPQLNATLTSNQFSTSNAVLNGSVSGDLRVNARAQSGGGDNLVTLRLQIFDATVGSGFDSLYTTADEYEFNLTAYDIDANNAGTNADSVTAFGNFSYTQTTSSTVNADPSTPGQVLFSAATGTSVGGQDGLTPPLTQEQADATIIFNYQNVSDIRLDYNVLLTSGARTFLLDGGPLANGLDPFTTTTVIVPEPSSASLASLAALALFRRRRSL